MSAPSPRSALVAVLAPFGATWVRAPALDPPAGSPTTVVRCTTPAELLVLLRAGPRIDTALLDGTVPGVDRDLLGEVVRSGGRPVIIDDAPHRRGWHDLGAVLVLPPHADLTPAIGIPAQPAGPPSAATTGCTGPGAATPPVPSVPSVPRRRLAPLVVVAGGPATDPAAIAVSLARSLVDRLGPGRVALVDLTLDGWHRAAHGLVPQDPGLPELAEALRTDERARRTIATYGHEAPDGYRVVPGLRRHHDWVRLGPDSLAAAIRSLRAGSGAVVAHADPDVEGHQATGSFDVEDRNLLARTAFGAADLGVVAGPSTPVGVRWLHQLLPELVELGLPASRARALLVDGRSTWRARPPIVADLSQLRALDLAPGQDVPDAGAAHRPRGVTPEDRRRRLGRGRDAIATLIDALLDGGHARTGDAGPGDEPTRIEPGQLGHWPGDAPGWITPKVPQQP